MSQRTISGTSEGRPARIRAIVLDYVRTRRDGGAVSREHFLAEHADLLPELEGELHKAEVIEQGRLRCLEDSKTKPTEAPEGETSRLALGLQPDSIPGYEIVCRIHRGGQGTVFEGVQLATHRRVAIKVFGEEEFAGPHERSRFEREVRILGALNHPHIVTIHDSGSFDGQFYFVMDYIDGKPLDVFMVQRPASIREKLELLARIGEAVHAAHLRGIIHRDLKPSNIRVDAQANPCVLDFGLAKVDESHSIDADVRRGITQTGQFVGSLPWASPEQVKGSPDRIDLRTDVYSLGVIVYHSLTGRFPYAVAGSTHEVMETILHTEPTKPGSICRDVNDEVETIIMKCLSKVPERRYQSAGDLALDIRRYLTGQPIEAKRDSTWYVFRKTVGRYKVPAALILTFMLVTAAFGLAMYLKAEENRWLANELISALDSYSAYLGFRMGEREPGRRLREKALEVARARYPLDHVRVAQAHHALAGFLHDMALHKEAEFHYRRALDIFRRLDLTHEVWHTHCWLGLLYKDMEKYTDAELLIRESLQWYRDHVGEGHVRTIEMYLAVAKFETDAGRLQEAEIICRNTMAAYILHFGENHVRTSEVFTQLGQVLVAQQRYAEAEPLLRQAHEIRQRDLPHTHWERAKTATLLGAALAGLGRCQEAGPLVLDNFPLIRADRGENHRRTAEAMERIILLHERCGEPTEADEWRRRRSAHPFQAP